MLSIERYADLMRDRNVDDWRNKVFRLGNELGYERTVLAILPDRHTPVQVEHAFVQTNYAANWLNKYDEEKMSQFDPTVLHCATKSTPLIWTPAVFAAKRQKEMYEEACSHGIRSGVTLPIHGCNGEFGLLCFVSDTRPDRRFEHEAFRNLAELCCLRDFVLETSQRFRKDRSRKKGPPELTARELECLKWSAAGKSSWEISLILNLSLSGINFHFHNLRKKLNVNSRRMAIVTAISMGLIQPPE